MMMARSLLTSSESEQHRKGHAASDGVKVPFALSEDDCQVAAAAAEKHSFYRCPSCLAEVILRRGTQRRPHFAHKAESTQCDFLHETEKHLRAKWALRDLARYPRSITLVHHCSACKRGRRF